jgi:polysaccharide export outer membrane protein
MLFPVVVARVLRDFGSIRFLRSCCAGVAIGFSLGGCGLLPEGGPTGHAIVGDARYDATAPYILVKLTPEVVSAVGEQKRPGFSAMGVRGGAPRVTLGIGDVVTVTIFEAAAGGLFIPNPGSTRPGNYVQLPDQIVDNSGNITVPYAGAVKAAGRSIPDIQADIVARLGDRAIEPQVVITLKEQKASQISVLGEVNAPSRFPVNPSGDRVLDVIAKAGGPKYPGYETYVTLQRGRNEGTESFTALASNPADNVYVRSGDTIIVSRRPESFVALGAQGKNGQFNFDADRVSISEALGKASGLSDLRANPRYVFLYRMEDPKLLESIGYPADQFGGGPAPTIYMVDLRQPDGYFLASRFDLRDKDVLYAANAAATDLAKVFALVRGSFGVAVDVRDF